MRNCLCSRLLWQLCCGFSGQASRGGNPWMLLEWCDAQPKGSKHWRHCCIVLYNNISHSSYLEQYIALYAAAMLCSGSLLVYQARVYMNWSRNATRTIRRTTTTTLGQSRPRLDAVDCVVLHHQGGYVFVIVWLFVFLCVCIGLFRKLWMNFSEILRRHRL